MIDSHCHLDSRKFDADREAVIERALAAGVEQMLTIGTGDGPPDLEGGFRLADQYPFLYTTVGVHPHEADKVTDATLADLERLLAHPKVVAFGEIGLDYHYNFSSPDTQRKVFRDQLAIARSANKPVIIHTREAWADTAALLREHWPLKGSPGGIMHCFSGGPHEARESLEMGFYISFAGVVTFPKALDLQQAAREVPLDRLLIETDAPYLAPVPFRGKRNEPAFVAHTAAKVAELRGISKDDLIAATTANFHRLTGALSNS
jgi:TatD DNase family protein